MESIAERFARETADHHMTVLHDDGLYRHLRFQRETTSMYWFDLITVPGALIFRGDGESYVFSRLNDMFEFFRGPVGRINPGYWAEKVTSSQKEIKRYDRDIFTRRVMEALAETPGELYPAGLAQAVHTELLGSDDAETEEGAHRLLREFEFNGFQFGDTWEWDFRDYHWWFLWVCHAIVWGIAYYDHGERPAPQPPPGLPGLPGLPPATPARRPRVETTQPAGGRL